MRENVKSLWTLEGSEGFRLLNICQQFIAIHRLKMLGRRYWASPPPPHTHTHPLAIPLCKFHWQIPNASTVTSINFTSMGIWLFVIKVEKSSCQRLFETHRLKSERRKIHCKLCISLHNEENGWKNPFFCLNNWGRHAESLTEYTLKALWTSKMETKYKALPYIYLKWIKPFKKWKQGHQYQNTKL